MDRHDRRIRFFSGQLYVGEYSVTFEKTFYQSTFVTSTVELSETHRLPMRALAACHLSPSKAGSAQVATSSARPVPLWPHLIFKGPAVMVGSRRPGESRSIPQARGPDTPRKNCTWGAGARECMWVSSGNRPRNSRSCGHRVHYHRSR